MADKPGKIYRAVVQIMREVGAIGKDSKNQTQNYAYRSAEAVYNRVQPLMATHGVFSVPRVLEESRETGQSKQGGTMHWAFLRVEYTFYAEDGSNIVVVVSGEGMDSGDKATAKAMTVCHRYAICQLINIPYAVVDPEQDTPAWAARLDNGIKFADLNHLKLAWMERYPIEGKSREQLLVAFAEFVAEATGQRFDVADWRQWSVDDVRACYESLGVTDEAATK
jgi:hypothetical protein